MVVAALLLPVLACTGPDSDSLTVFAASSLTDVLPALADAYKAETGIAVTAVYGGSNHLTGQLRDGAPADVFLTADARLLGRLETRGETVDFATNHLVVAVPAGNPAAVTGASDLARADLRVVVCAETVPCGAATARMGIVIEADSREISVRAVLSRLALGEADAGVVYATDVAAEPGVELAWPQPEACPCVVYAAAAITDRAMSFIGFLTSPTAQETLALHGFSIGAPG